MVDHRALGVELFNRTWQLMDQSERTAADDDLLAHCAHASAYHWREVGTAENFARSEWQVSRAYTVLGRAEPALHHARRCLAICEENGIADWDLGFAYEALARACATAGDTAAAQQWTDRAAAVGIAEDDDRQLLLSDLATIPGVARPSAPEAAGDGTTLPE
jgi:hypothetical protein